MKDLLIFEEYDIDDWVSFITKKKLYEPLGVLAEIKNLNVVSDDICQIFGIPSLKEKINKAILLIYAKQHGLVTSYEEACDVINYKSELIISGVDEVTKSKILSQHKLEIIIKALNNGWTPDWNDFNEYKYFSFFDMSGGFSFSGATYSDYSTDVSSAFCLKSELLAWYCGNMFIDLYEIIYS